MTQNTSQIYSAMVAIMRDMDAVTKARTNSHQRYQYRGIDDLYNHCHSLLAKHGVFCLPEVLKCEREAIETAGGKSAVSTLVTVKFRFFAEDGSSVEVIQIGEGMDLGDKSANKALSTAQKYALIQTFLKEARGKARPKAFVQLPFLPVHPLLSFHSICLCPSPRDTPFK